ncbi:extracellular solute-binding protein [Alphaproteobacteria bacterium]|nr:extracellular solute-binding protein [Alphaproteobacteria bacterium]
MKSFFAYSFIFSIFILFSNSAFTQPMHGISMHGELKYQNNFEYLDYVNPKAPKGGQLRLGVTGTFNSLNPFIIKGKSAAGRQYVFESLLARVWDEPFSLYGLIAESVDVTEDRSSVTFIIRKEARFHDNSEITSKDVYFSWLTLKDKGRANMRIYYNKVKKVEIISEKKITFIFDQKEIDRELPLLIGMMPIISEKYFEDKEFDKTTLDPLLGSGPYKITEIDPGRSLTYERVKDYWGQSLPVRVGHNNFDKIKYEYFRDSNVLMEAFKAREFDLKSEYSPSRWHSEYKFPAVKDGSVILEALPNQRPAGMRALVFNTRKNIFKDLRVRKALNYAFDFEWVNKNLLHNSYKRTQSYFANSDLASSGFPTDKELKTISLYEEQLDLDIINKDFKNPKFLSQKDKREGLRKAKALLEEAGTKVENGQRFLNDKTKLNFEILLVKPDNERLALIFSENLKRLGIKANVRIVDSSQYQLRRQNYDFDMIIHKWGVTLSPGNEQYYYWGSASADKQGTRNYIGIKSSVVDNLVSNISKTTSRNKLVTYMRVLDRILLNNYYVIPLYHKDNDWVAYWDNLKHPLKTPIYGFVLETWWDNKIN